MNISFRSRVMLSVAVASTLCTIAGVLISRYRIQNNGENALVDKSRAILSRLEVGRDYVADMDTLGGVVADMTRRFPDGNLPPDQKLKVLKSVPVFAAFKLGEREAAKENYEFRVSSLSPRREENRATASEAEILRRFEADPNLHEVISRSEDGNSLIVTRPVRLSEKQGCLTCHGDPMTSPWRNGKDILGYPMEHMRDGQLRGAFSIISRLQPVRDVTRASTNSIMLWGFLLTIVALFGAFLMMRGPIEKLTEITAELNSAGQELGGASTQISSVSQTLSASSTESAASLEQTVSSIQEVSGMITRNSDAAREAANLAQGSRQVADKGEKEIQQLITAIQEISSSSRKIEEITGVIDDIAFQTNLLALNAAVEAARAGEQGKGFAVVAEAVRSLAQRSALAAKDITHLIRESVDKVENGSKVATASGTVLAEIVHSVKRVADLNGEIASASSEQASAVQRINTVMEQLDQTTQQNAAASEEAAASAEEMSAQALALRNLVVELHATIQGAAADSGSSSGDGGSADRKVASVHSFGKSKRSGSTNRAA